MKPTLEARIQSIRAECADYIHRRAVEIGKSSPGLPVQNIEMMLQNSGCPCAAALKVISTRVRDKEIADAQA